MALKLNAKSDGAAKFLY